MATTASVRLYYNTGFTFPNLPDSEALLNTFEYRDFPTINTLIGRVLDSITISATYDDIQGADYLRIIHGLETTFYTISGAPVPYGSTCWTLNITIDPLMSIGGINGITAFTDGITDRHHVPKSLDTFGAYTEEDPLIAPSKPLVYDGVLLFEKTGVTYTICEATTDLVALGDTSITPHALVYFDNGIQGNSEAVVPELPSLGAHETRVTAVSPLQDGAVITTTTPETCYFFVKKIDESDNPNNQYNNKVKKGIDRARSLGVEAAIISQYNIDALYAFTDTNANVNGYITTLSGKAITRDVSNDLPIEYGVANNMRIFCGINNACGLVSIGSGEQVEFVPEDVVNADGTLSVRVVADPRSKGKPLFRFRTFKGDTDNFYMNCIRGAEWQNAPLKYEGASGSEIIATQYHQTRNIAETNLQTEAYKTGGMLKNAGANLGVGIAQFFRSFGHGIEDDINQATRGISKSPYDPQYGAIQQERQRQAYFERANTPVNKLLMEFDQQKAKDALQFGISTNIVAPVISFPRSNMLRDFVGNAVYAYKYKLSGSDFQKIDKILSAYGYRDTAIMETSFLNNRSKFNYVKANGVSVQTVLDTPKWLREAVSAMFQSGVRIWHVAPNTAYYTNGQNV